LPQIIFLAAIGIIFILFGAILTLRQHGVFSQGNIGNVLVVLTPGIVVMLTGVLLLILSYGISPWPIQSAGEGQALNGEPTGSTVSTTVVPPTGSSDTRPSSDSPKITDPSDGKTVRR
jgi:hypothetical protein